MALDRVGGLERWQRGNLTYKMIGLVADLTSLLKYVPLPWGLLT